MRPIGVAQTSEVLGPSTAAIMGFLLLLKINCLGDGGTSEDMNDR